MIPCHFGPDGQQRVGIYHAPRASVATDSGVVLCAPIGQEYMRTHRPLRQLALALADAGMHVLRFDYLGTGDSAGAIGDGSLEAWIGDISLAAGELHDISGASRLALVGLRTGALLAASAHARGVPGADRLVLWDPVVSGRDYLLEMQALHAALARTMRPVPPVPSDELLGYPYPGPLRCALAAIDLVALAATLPAGGVDLLVSEPRPEYRRLRTALAAAGRIGEYIESSEPGAWTDLPEAFNVMLASRTVQSLAALVSATRDRAA
jgi:pimeloyl-ACP methyl ester carboxylesterase